MLIDMLIFRFAMMGRRLSGQSRLFEARPRDFVKLQLPVNAEPTADTARGATGVGLPGRKDEPGSRD